MDTQIIHNLLDTVELAYESAISAGETTSTAAQCMRQAALNAIQQERIPRTMFRYAEMFFESDAPYACLKNARKIFPEPV